MKLTYIYHSGYAIEGNGFTIIIDYYQDSSENPSEGIVHKQLLKNPGKLYVLSTHSHHDHFNKEILKWKKTRPDIVYLLSQDILDNQKARENDGIYIEKLGIYEDGTIRVKAYGSTDLGISYMIEADGRTIFHAGDLNNWHWRGEWSEREANEAEAFYLSELQLIANDYKHIDLAMFPIDHRLGKDYMLGAEQFVNTIKTDIFAPMHFGESYDTAAAFEPYAIKADCRFINWKYKGESIHF